MHGSLATRWTKAELSSGLPLPISTSDTWLLPRRLNPAMAVYALLSGMVASLDEPHSTGRGGVLAIEDDCSNHGSLKHQMQA